MRILFITDNFPPEVNAPANRTFEHCRAWVKAGASVTVITCAPNFPQGRVYEGFTNRLYQKESVEGIRVLRVWSYIAKNAGVKRRILDYLSFSLTSLCAGLFQRFDIVVATSPQFFTTIAGWALSVLKRRPWVFEVRDLWPESIVAVGAMKEGRLIRSLERLEMFMYRHADLIVPVTDAFKERLVERGVDSRKIVVVPNGVNRIEYTRRDKNSELELELGLSGKFVYGYIGTHGMAHGLDFIVSCLGQISHRNVVFLFVGDGAEKSRIVDLANREGLKNAIFLDSVPRHKVVDYLSVMDAALVNLKKSETFRTVIPSKIFEAAAMGKPILLGVDGQARRIVEGHSAGLFFEPENGGQFVKQATELAVNPELYRRLQEGCQRLAVNFDRDKLAAEMLSNLREVISPLRQEGGTG